jgi:hypothetical protein
VGQFTGRLDDLAVFRASDRPLTDYFVMGERCSGTNFLGNLAWKNLGLKVHSCSQWKHGFPVFHAPPPGLAILVTYRDAISWAKSLFERPWHASPAIRTLDFERFLRAPWESVVDERYKIGNAGFPDLIGAPLQADRHPISGVPFANIFRLRTAKLRALLGLRQRGFTVAYVPHEVVKANPERTIARIAEALSVNRPRAFSPAARRLGGHDVWRARKVQVPELLSSEDLAFLSAELDSSLERRLCYSYWETSAE